MTRLKTWLLAISACSGLSRGAQVCNLAFDTCPGNFTAGTITVPQNVIWLDPVVPVCPENARIVTGTTSPPPSIVFIIDNSGSMGTSLGEGSDPQAQRFKVTTSLMDSIYKAAPNTEVGLVIFSRRLAFEDRDNPFFKPAFPADPAQHDAYVPLTKLNQVFADGKLGVDTLKALLSTTPGSNGKLVYNTRNPESRPNKNINKDPAGTVTDPAQPGKWNVRDGTDITLGFEAAKQAMASATAARENRFFIFLSDGAPSDPDDSRLANQYDFEQGKAAPTTYTVFFTDDGTVPARIATMMNNIKANGYSSGNPKSAGFPIDTRLEQLLPLLQSNVLNPIFANVPAKAVSAVMAVGGTDYASTGVDTRNFTFAKRVPLAADRTVVDLAYTYTYGDSGKTKTKTVPYTLTVKRAPAGTPPLGSGLSSVCQDQGAITLYNGAAPVALVTADHAKLDVHLTLANGETCNGCAVEVKPNKSADKENVVLAPDGGVQVGSFGRETSASVKAADGTLQHLPSDSIVVTYVNPDNPLDVIRKAFPYSDVSTTLTVIRHNDYSRGGDVVEPRAGEHFVLVAPTALNPVPESDGKNWSITPVLATSMDSLRYVGNVIEASRAFKVDIQIYTNLGQYVNKIRFTVSQSEFAKLSKGIKNNTRRLKVLWDNRAADGTMAGTGAYILKTTVTLLKIPGIAEDEAVSTDYRIVGVLRSIH
ncbi:MAG TPA: VWA domain-containing protein [Fibrobacteria bacterium]|nr:VWA domain-containing protein [Fibrobacteria bacterium]